MDVTRARARLEILTMIVERAEPLNSLPQKTDFTSEEIIAIKDEFGSMPRALEAAGLKPVSAAWINKQKSKKKRRTNKLRQKENR